MLSAKRVLSLIPHEPPFRFLDRLTEVDCEHAVAEYTFRPSEYYYRGHFRSFPVTPGVILVESMAQASMAIAIQLLASERPLAEIGNILMVLAESSAEFERMVLPGSTVRIEARKLFWRRNKLKATAEMTLPDGAAVSRATVGLVGVHQGAP
jgi:3-hydroxyacyl-[acyl-carrier-protein] dehydratase